MMNKIIFLFGLILFFACNNVEEEHKESNDLQNLNLFGKVRSVREVNYDAAMKFGEIVKMEIGANNSGISLPTRKVTNYKFDVNGSMTSHTELYTGGGFYDRLNIKEDPDIIKDSDGKILKHIKRFSDGRILNTTTYFYDEKGNLIKEDVTDLNGELHLRYILKYDKNNNLINKAGYYGDGSLVSQDTYRYDDNNRITEKGFYDRNLADQYNIPNYTAIISYLYNIKGQLIKETYTVVGNVFEIKEFEYDENGNITRISRNQPFDPRKTETLSQFTYKFDERQNWVEMITFIDYEPQKITTREILYY